MLCLFARRRHPGTSSEAGFGPSAFQGADVPRRRARWRLRPGAEVLDRRLLMASGSPAGVASTDLADRVATAVRPYLAQGSFPGLSVAVVRDGEVVLAQGYGLANVKGGSPVGADTRFDIGSVTKTFTAVGALMLYQESQGTSRPLDLDAPISDYLHNNRSFKLPRAWSHLTTRQLLAMTSGIQDTWGFTSWQGEVAKSARIPLRFTPGTKSLYSDVNYNLLGELIEQWTGQSYNTFIQNRILGPLGMTQTQMLGRSATVPNQAVGYSAPRHGKWPRAASQNGPELYAAAGMVSSARDMATYMQALLSGRLLDPATYRLMWTSTPTLEYGVNPPTDSNRGLGWDTAIDNIAGPTEVTKSGDVPGYTSELILHPDSDSGVFVSFNSTYHHGSVSSGGVALRVAEAVAQATGS